MAGISKTRVDYGDKGPGFTTKDAKSNDNATPSSVSDQTNAKVPIDGVDNESRESTSSAKPTTRPVTGGK